MALSILVINYPLGSPLGIDASVSYLLFCLANRERRNEMQAYCMKCRTKREMKDAKSIKMKNGKPATQGVCPVCGTKMFRIGKS